jgi:hypothetical protein
MRLVMFTLCGWVGIAVYAAVLVHLWLVYSPADSDSAYTALVILSAIGLINLSVLGTHTARSVRVLRCRFDPAFRRQMIADLDFPSEPVRCQALQTLVDFHDAPVGTITCWPVRQCTNLQLTTMEAVFGQWLETTGKMPAPSEEKVIDALFTFAPDEMPIEKPLAQPESKEGDFERELDRLREIVKDAVLDWNASTFAPDDPTPDEDAPLGPLLREPFIAAMREKVTETVEQVADLVGAAPTVRALADYEPRVAEMLADLRGEALALALEMRGVQTPTSEPVVRSRTDPPHRSVPRWLRPDGPWPPAPEFSGGWVKKYRRIRRAGL